MVDVVICFLGLMIPNIRFCSFWRHLVYAIYSSTCITTQIFWSGYLKSRIGPRWYPERDCFKNSDSKIFTLTATNIIKSMFTLNNIWSFWPAVVHKRIARIYKRLFMAHCLKSWSILRTYLRTADTFHIVEYLGIAGLKSKTPFKIYIRAISNVVSHSQLWLLLTKQISQCLQIAIIFHCENTLLNA